MIIRVIRRVIRRVKIPTPFDFQNILKRFNPSFETRSFRNLSFGSRQDLNYQDAVKFGLKSGEVGQNMGRSSEMIGVICRDFGIEAIFETETS